MPSPRADTVAQRAAELERMAREELARRAPPARLAGDPAPKTPTPGKAAEKPAAAKPAKPKKSRREDLTLAALGVTLGLICALFPWYIFMNPSSFGIRAIEFTGDGDYRMGGVVPNSPAPDRIGALSLGAPALPGDVDLMSTGSTATNGSPPEPAPAEQPFPAQPAAFDLLEVVNGRAMLQDETGIFVAQRGSRLPDGSTVKAIEQRGGRWVLVTSEDEVIGAAE